MNERILKLREQAGLQPYYDAQEQQIEKFAELIVKECAQVILRWKNEPFPFDEDLAASLLEEYFGINNCYGLLQNS